MTTRSTEELLGATTSSTWAHVATYLKALRLAETSWTLLRPGTLGRKSGSYIANREFLYHKQKLEEPVARYDAVRDRLGYLADLKASGFVVEQPDHPLLRMIREGTMWSENPNLQYSGYDVATWMGTTVESVGEWDLALVRNDSGVPVHWMPIPPPWVRPPPGKSQPNYEVPRLGLFGSKAIPPQDMAVYRRANPTDPFGRGRGDAHATDVETAIDEGASTHIVSRLQNHGIPLLLMILSGMTDPEKKSFEHEWQRDLTGPLRAGMTKFLKAPEAVDLKTGIFLKELQQSVVDLGLPELRGHTRDALLIGNRVPPLAAGEQRSGNRAMSLVAEKMIEVNAITPAREGYRSFLDSRFFQPVGGREPEYRGGFIVMWESREMTDEGSRDRMMAQQGGHFSTAQFKRVAGQQPDPGDEDIRITKTNEIVWNQRTGEIIFAPPQPAGGTPFGADIEPPVAKLSDELVALAQLTERMEYALGQGE